MRIECSKDKLQSVVNWQQVLPKVILEEPRRKVTISFNGTPQIQSQNPNLPFPFDDNHSHLIHSSSTDPTHHPKRHKDLLCHFATINFAVRQTDRQTDRHVPSHKPLNYARLIESDAANNNYRPMIRRENFRQIHYV